MIALTSSLPPRRYTVEGEPPPPKRVTYEAHEAMRGCSIAVVPNGRGGLDYIQRGRAPTLPRLDPVDPRVAERERRVRRTVRLVSEGKGVAEVRALFGCSKSTAYRYLNEARARAHVAGGRL